MRAGSGPLEERGRAVRGGLTARCTELAPLGTICGVNGCVGCVCHVMHLDGRRWAVCAACKAALQPRGGMTLAQVGALFGYARPMDDEPTNGS